MKSSIFTIPSTCNCRVTHTLLGGVQQQAFGHQSYWGAFGETFYSSPSVYSVLHFGRNSMDKPHWIYYVDWGLIFTTRTQWHVDISFIALFVPFICYSQVSTSLHPILFVIFSWLSNKGGGCVKFYPITTELKGRRLKNSAGNLMEGVKNLLTESVRERGTPPPCKINFSTKRVYGFKGGFPPICGRK